MYNAGVPANEIVKQENVINLAAQLIDHGVLVVKRLALGHGKQLISSLWILVSRPPISLPHPRLISHNIAMRCTKVASK